MIALMATIESVVLGSSAALGALRASNTFERCMNTFSYQLQETGFPDPFLPKMLLLSSVVNGMDRPDTGDHGYTQSLVVEGQGLKRTTHEYRNFEKKTTIEMSSWEGVDNVVYLRAYEKDILKGMLKCNHATSAVTDGTKKLYFLLQRLEALRYGMMDYVHVTYGLEMLAFLREFLKKPLLDWNFKRSQDGLVSDSEIQGFKLYLGNLENTAVQKLTTVRNPGRYADTVEYSVSMRQPSELILKLTHGADMPFCQLKYYPLQGRFSLT